MQHVLFVCLHNGRALADEPGAVPASRRRPPHRRLRRHRARRARPPPRSSRACASSGVDLANRRPRRLSDELTQRADVVVTMGCGDQCAYIPSKRYIDWDLPDPSGRAVEAVRAIRDDIRRRVLALIDELDHPPAAQPAQAHSDH